MAARTRRPFGVQRSSRRLTRHHLHARTVAAVLSLGAPAALRGQAIPEPLTVATTADTVGVTGARAALEFTLSRPIATGDGEVALVVGGMDVTALAQRSGVRLVYRPDLLPLPAGRTDVVVYRRRGAEWTELARWTLQVASPIGFVRHAVQPSLTVGSRGQVAEGRSAGIPAPERPTYQDGTLSGSLQTTHERPRLTIETSSSFTGGTRREEALRFGTLQREAPRIDLADYRVQVRGGGANLTIGHTTFGTSRHLVRGFGSRGVTVGLGRAGTQLSLGALNAVPIVGWDQLIGLNRPTNRVLGAAVAQELVPRRPGAVRVEATVLDATRLPLNGFRQGAVLDAEASRGGAVEVALATPGQRLRLTGGASRSRFDNPARDRELVGDTVIRAVVPETRGARFVEAQVGVLPARQVRGLGTVALALAGRHDRVDPLYRSVPTPVQADREHGAADATLSLGALTGQVGWSSSRDNLARLPTILTTRSSARTVTAALPVAQLVRARRAAAALPALSASVQQLHQRGDGIPEGGVFAAGDVPDQMNTTRDIGATWQAGRWRVALRHNRAHQDNRQPGRAAADFTTGSNALSVGTGFGSGADVAVDLGDDLQLARERDERTVTRRLTLNANLRRGQGTSLVLALSLLRTRPPTGPTTLTSEQRVEFTRPLLVLRDATGGARGQLFLRFGRNVARLPDFLQAATDPAATTTRRQWSLASGLNLRVF
jgi:hypothetical protein